MTSGSMNRSADLEASTETHADAFPVSPTPHLVAPADEQTVNPGRLELKHTFADKSALWNEGPLGVGETTTSISDPSALTQDWDIMYLSKKRIRENDLELQRARLEIEETQVEAQEGIQDLQVRRHELEIERIRTSERAQNESKGLEDRW